MQRWTATKVIRQTDTERVAEMDREVKGMGHRKINRETVIEMKEGRDEWRLREEDREEIVKNSDR